MASDPKPLAPELLALARDYAVGARGVSVPGGVGGMRALVADLVAEIDRWRRLSPVTADDVRERGIDYGKALASWREHNTDDPDWPFEDDEYMSGDDKIAWMCNAAVDQWVALDAYQRDCKR